MSDKAHGKRGSNRRWIGTMELADLLGCHPMSIQRFVKTKPGFPQPIKLHGNKNLYDADEAEAYVAKLLAEAAVALRALPGRSVP
jgi:predicted DNA-binding transcriptional regulator AlpA